MTELLKTISKKEALSTNVAAEIMHALLDPAASPAQVGAMLALISQRTPVASEILGFAKYLLSLNPLPAQASAIDVCGTGGDGLGTFNISTAVAFVVASCQRQVVKHGNRSVSSRSGSIDVLEALDIRIAKNETDVLKDLAEFQLSFLFAPAFHPAFAMLGPVRRSLGFRTLLNVLGPLINPMKPLRRVVGVYSQDLLLPVGEVLMELGCQEAFVLCAEDGMDEVSLSAPTRAVHLKHGDLEAVTLTAESFGLGSQRVGSVPGGDAFQNAELMKNIFQNQKSDACDLVLANAATALLISGTAANLLEGVQIAIQAIASGRVSSLVRRMRQEGQ